MGIGKAGIEGKNAVQELGTPEKVKRRIHEVEGLLALQITGDDRRDATENSTAC